MKNYFSKQYLSKGKLTSLLNSVGLREVIDFRSTNQTIQDGKYYQNYYVLTPFSIARVEISCEIRPQNFAGAYPFTNYYAKLIAEFMLNQASEPDINKTNLDSNGEQVRYLWEKWKHFLEERESLHTSHEKGQNSGISIAKRSQIIDIPQIYVHQTNIVKNSVILRSSLRFDQESQRTIHRICNLCNKPIPPTQLFDICGNCAEKSHNPS